jgi:hypothetical protein
MVRLSITVDEGLLEEVRQLAGARTLREAIELDSRSSFSDTVLPD